MESKSDKRDKQWLEERVEEVERELGGCWDKAQINLDEIEVTEVKLEILREKRGEEGQFMSSWVE